MKMINNWYLLVPVGTIYDDIYSYMSTKLPIPNRLSIVKLSSVCLVYLYVFGLLLELKWYLFV